MGPSSDAVAGPWLKQGSVDYQPVHQEDGAGSEPPSTPLRRSAESELRHLRFAVYVLAPCLAVLAAFNLFQLFPSSVSEDGSCPCKPSKVPQYFQTSPELWPGPTATGSPAFLAESMSWKPTSAYVPNQPLQTSIPVEGMAPTDESIFRLMGFLSPYAPSPGFGVDEYPLPVGADIVQVQMLSRHGSRYPTTGSKVERFARRIANVSADFKPKGSLAFLQHWKYQLGAEILVPNGRQELFQSGILHSYMYGALYNPKSKIIARTTTQDRMLKSAENWLAGFFGLEWTNNATIEVIIEQDGFNNSLAGSSNCPNAYPNSLGDEARDAWARTYLKNATARFQNMTDGFVWTAEDVYSAQTMCPYETVAFGSSPFCGLFTYEEWKGFSYSIDLYFSGSSAFHSPTGRAMGLGYQQEMMARLKNHTLGYSGSQINVTLDNNTETFPLNQSLYFDFSHDTNIVSILTALGLVQFAEDLPVSGPPGDHVFTVGHITPFGARFDLELIRTPQPVSPARDGYLEGGETRYIHLVLNQRTVPLGKSFPECDASRKDGWCELGAFLKVQEGMASRAKFDQACFGDYPRVPYGRIKDGAPL
ncbi:hypothetical protein XA68_17619 [Ophiocordyceps unilateralis]|uniref:3-phytase n=1 Tax=Ophiocordyceps unilateralis TaxID=268505 RepID=A0A2A9P4A5_OPHUN|nr:hypothetical protein XA68_17619 [Ophiocordyceps unilateralis]